MKAIMIELNQYYREQYFDNPQLFETNLTEEFFPYLNNYRVVIKKHKGANFMILTVVIDDRGEFNDTTRFGRIT